MSCFLTWPPKQVRDDWNLIAPNHLPPWPDPELHMYSTRNTSDLPEVKIITNERPTPLDDQVHDVIRCVQIQ